MSKVPRLTTCRLSSLLILLVAATSIQSGCSGISARGLNAQGVREFNQAEFDQAIDEFQKAIDRDPRDPDGYYNLARTYHRLGTLQGNETYLVQAEQLYNQCLDRDENHGDAYRALAVLLAEQGRQEEAFRLLHGWVDRSPMLADARIELARLYQESGEREAAKEQLVAALAVDSENPRALTALGMLREEMGEYNEAIANYQRSLHRNRFQPEVAARVASLQRARVASVPGMQGAPSTGTQGTFTVRNPLPPTTVTR